MNFFPLERNKQNEQKKQCSTKQTDGNKKFAGPAVCCVKRQQAPTSTHLEQCAINTCQWERERHYAVTTRSSQLTGTCKMSKRAVARDQRHTARVHVQMMRARQKAFPTCRLPRRLISMRRSKLGCDAEVPSFILS